MHWVPLPRYALNDSLDLSIDSLCGSVQASKVSHICDVLEGQGHVTEGVECFRRMQNELAEDTHDERVQWELGEGSKRLVDQELMKDLP